MTEHEFMSDDECRKIIHSPDTSDDLRETCRSILAGRARLRDREQADGEEDDGRTPDGC